jgi:MFS family permease
VSQQRQDRVVSGADARRVLGFRSARGLADGLVSVLLPAHLVLLGFSATEVGLVTTLSLVGSALATISLPFLARSLTRRQLLVAAGVLMAITGAGFGLASGLVVVGSVAFVGTANPTGGDVSVFVPVEQAVLSQSALDRHRTALFARYALAGSLATATGALAAGLPGRVVAGLQRGRLGIRPLAFGELAGTRAAFGFYAAMGLVGIVVYRQLSAAVEAGGEARGGLGESRLTVLRLTALFAVDSFGSGFASQSTLVLWLFLRFQLSVAEAGLILFWTGLATSASMLLSPVLARRIGLIRTMVFTHIPANLFLIAAALAPRLPIAFGLLLARALLSTMDVPARSSYVMAVVTPPERTAAAAVTGVARSMAAVPGPLLAGLLLDANRLAWPLVVAGSIKTIYDLTLLVLFGRVPAPEEVQGRNPP